MFLAMPKPARAGRLGADIIALFPKEIGEFAYADLKKARSLKWFSQLQEQMLPTASGNSKNSWLQQEWIQFAG